MLSWRIASALTGIPLLLGATYVGGRWLAALTAVLAWLGAGEMGRLAPEAGPVARVMARAWAVGAPVVALEAPEALGEAAVAAALLFLAAQTVASLRARDAESVARLGRAAGPGVLLVLYPSFPLAHLVLLAGLPDAAGRTFTWAWAVLAAVWASDTLAFFGGRWLGGPRLAPAVSPGKRWSGALAGLGGAALAGAAVGGSLARLPLSSGAAFGLAVGLAGQVGDLLESLLKRGAGVKDSGRVIPGHGGVLDRFDSLVVALPVSYHLLTRLGWAG